MSREADPYEHEGIKGWHHHHGHFGAVEFHEQGTFRPLDSELPDDQGHEFSTHYAGHDEWQGSDEPCQDPECVWLLPFGVEGGSTIGRRRPPKSDTPTR